MKRVSAVVLIICSILCAAGFAQGAEEKAHLAEASMESQLESLDLSQLQQFIDEIDKDMGAYLPDFSIQGVIEDLRSGELDLNFGGFLKGMVEYLFHELVAHSALLGRLVVLAVICAILYNLLDAFEGSTGQLAHTIVYLLLIAVALGSFTAAVKVGSEAITNMVNFVQALLPVLLTLLAAVGGISSAAILHPFIIAALGLLGTLIKDFIFPLIYLSAVLGIVNHISDRVKVSRLAGLLKQVSITSLGIFLTMFVGFLGLQGVAGAVADSVTLKTAKFMTGAFVPVVGKMLADAAEVVLGTSLLIKNAVGIVGIVILFIICLFPVIKIMAMVLVYRLAAALVQPIGDSKVADALDTMANMLTLVFASVAAVGLMFFLAVAVIVGLGNINVMLR